jgi:3-oxoacyl-[acyl-carrier-protein] synthase II
METPLVITGIGLTTGLGVGVEANWRRLCAGDCGLEQVTAFSTEGFPVTRGGEAPPLPDGETPTDRRDRAHAYLVGACAEALAMAGIGAAVPHGERAALVVGSSLAAQASSPGFWERYLTGEAGPDDFRALRSYDVELRLADLARRFGVRGEALLVSNACAAGASALGLAADAIRLGRADLVLVAGYDALDMHTVAGFGCIKALDPDSVRPFSADRGGMMLGDGFAALVVEREEQARAAGREPLARLLGHGDSADAHHLTQPHPEGRGASLAMSRALRLAELEPSAIDYVNAHATATPPNDVAEYKALRNTFGGHLASLPVGATKPAVGHTLGGAGAVETTVALLALRHQTLPPTLTLSALDPEIDMELDRVPAARPAELRCVMSNSFGFGGCNASVVVGEVGEARQGTPLPPASRVVITGLGVAAPLGTGNAELWAGLAGEPRLVAPPTRKGGIEPPCSAAVFAPYFKAEAYTDRRAVRKASDLARLAAGAAQLALDDATFPADEDLRRDTPVVLGTTFGSSGYYLEFHETIRRRGLNAGNAVLFTESVFNAAAGHVSKIHGLRGAGHTLAGGEDAGLSALVTAVDQVRLGRTPAAVAGGVEQYADLVQASLLHAGLIGEGLPGAFAETPAALGGGAAVLVCEALEHARARGAGAWAEILGSARTRPGPGDDEAAAASALVDAARAACEEAGVAPADVDLVVGSGAGGARTRRELAAMSELGLSAYCGPGAALGEGFAFTSAAQAAVGALALALGDVPPTHGGDAAPSGASCTPGPRSLARVLVLASSRPGAATALVLGPCAELETRALA